MTGAEWAETIKGLGPEYNWWEGRPGVMRARVAAAVDAAVAEERERCARVVRYFDADKLRERPMSLGWIGDTVLALLKMTTKTIAESIEAGEEVPVPPAGILKSEGEK